ncbi:MAG: DMT family transporter [Acidimicrobiia bacterium]
MSPTSRTDGRAVAAVVAAAALFGTTGTAQELGPDGTTPLGLGSLRILIGTMALWLLAARSIRSLRRLDRNGWIFVAIGGIGVAGYQPTFLAGTERSGVALGTVVALGSGPVFAGLVDVVRTRRMPPSTWLAATATSITGGVLLVSSGGGAARFDLVGILAALAAGASYALYADTTKRLIISGVGSTAALAASFTVGTVLLLVLAAGEPFGWVGTPGGLALLGHLGLVTIGVAYWLYGYGLRHVPVPKAVTLTLAEPVTAAMLGVVVLDERIAPLGWAGIALVLAGLALAARDPERRAEEDVPGTSLTAML